MNHTTTTNPTPMERADDAIDRAETLSLKLSGLCEMVKLTAFASEARRALKSIHHVLGGYPGATEAIIASMDTANQWTTMEDNTRSVLECIARQLDECNQKNLQVAYDLADLAAPKPDARRVACVTPSDGKL